MSSLVPASQPKDPLLPSSPNKKLPFRLTNDRWWALVLMNCILLGGSYCYDNPQALETKLVAQLGISSYEFNLLYSIIAFPGIILPLVGGYICDYFGISITLTVSTSILAIGQAVFTYGAYMSSYGWMLFGRFLYGIGSDAQAVSQNAMASKWFKGSEQAFAISLCTTIYGIGSIIDTFLTPRIQVYFGNLYAPTMFGLILCLVSLVLAFIMHWMDRENEKREMTTAAEVMETAEPQRIKFQDLKNFRPIFWWMALNYGLAGSVFFTFTNIANDFIGKRFGFDSVGAGTILSTLFIAMTFAAPLFGWVADKKAKRVQLIVAGCVLGIVCWTLFAFLPGGDQLYTVIIPLVGLGIFLGLYDGGLYGGMPLVVKEIHLGTAFGIITVVQNVTMTFVPMIVGAIQDDSSWIEYGYYWVCIFMIGYSFVTLLSCIPLALEDRRNNNLLEKFKPGMDIKAFMENTENLEKPNFNGDSSFYNDSYANSTQIGRDLAKNQGEVL